MIKNDECLLTVQCTSYNFAEYLEDCFEGFLSQKTDFRFKVVVFDDASTDGSQDIIKKYVEKYPEMFIACLAETNTYGKPERIRLLNQLYEKEYEGEYVAFCEGDDYWCDPFKLKKQVEFMKNNPDCSLSVHASRWIDYKKGCEYSFHPYSENRYLTAEEIILQQGGNPSTASQVFRMRDLIFDDSFHLKNGGGDYIRQLYQLSKGKVYYFDDEMSVYRFSHPGSWTDRNEKDVELEMRHRFEMYDFLEFYDEYTGGDYHEWIVEKQNNYMYDPFLLDDSIPMNDYYDMLIELPFVSKENIERYRQGRQRIGSIVRGEYTVDSELLRFFEGFDHVFMYGCGEYAGYLRKMLDTNMIDFEGYLISDNQDTIDPIDGKSVWRLFECPYELDKSLIIIGVGPKIGSIVKKNLAKQRIGGIISPFDFRGIDYEK